MLTLSGQPIHLSSNVNILNNYWSCKCENHFIHSSYQGNYCPYCDCHKDEGFVAVENEISLYNSVYDHSFFRED